MLRLIVGLLLFVPLVAVVGFALLLDGAPRREEQGPGRGEDPGVTAGAESRAVAGIVNVRATIELPPEFPRRYVNIDLDAERVVRDGLPAIRRVAIGTIDVSGWFAEQAMKIVLDRVPEFDDERYRLAVVRAVQSYPQRLDLVCDWPHSPVQHVRVRAVPEGVGSESGEDYASRIEEWVGTASGPRAPLLGLLRTLFEEAANRTAAGADPAAENRTAILIAVAEAFGCAPLSEGRPIRSVRPSLHRRDDLGRHFIGSAALAVLLDRELSESVGRDKEFSDSRAFSGFSFSDIAANRAGARFGELATASPRTARRVQDWMKQVESDGDIMPEVRDLPDHLPEGEFKRRFGDPGEDSYQRVLEDIEARIAQVPLYRVSK